jgi:shikimate kinase
MPGAGKSTVGVLLAKALKRPFLDTDLLVQTRTDSYLQSLIDTMGLAKFLDLEAEIIGDLNVDGHVIATGGSVVYRAATMAHLRAQGQTVFLSVPFPALANRLRNIATRGVVQRRGQTLQALYEERTPLYTQYADVTIDTANLTVEETVTRLVAALSSAGR